MARSKKRSLSIGELLSSLDQRLKTFGVAYAGLELREKVLCLVEIQDELREFNVLVVRDGGCDKESARERLEFYFREHVDIVLSSKELEVVSGIFEYARRVRELRVQFGYRILTGASNDPELGHHLKPDEYRLIAREPDREAAHRWYIASDIRKKKGGARAKLLEFFKKNVGKVVTSEELRYVTGGQTEWARRTRELRTELGYAVATCYTGRPDLKPGEYVLEREEPLKLEHLRDIPVEVQREVYARDNYTCQICGWSRDLWTRQDPRFLELHHRHRHVDGGANTAENLVVVCSRCHDGIHAGTVKESYLGPSY